jgi:hypothetical protein
MATVREVIKELLEQELDWEVEFEGSFFGGEHGLVSIERVEGNSGTETVTLYASEE